MKAIIDENGLLIHLYPNGRRIVVGCPYASMEITEACGDWCSLWQEPYSFRFISIGDGDGRNGRIMYRRIDCHGHEHVYDEFEDQREGMKK